MQALRPCLVTLILVASGCAPGVRTDPVVPSPAPAGAESAPVSRKTGDRTPAAASRAGAKGKPAAKAKPLAKASPKAPPKAAPKATAKAPAQPAKAPVHASRVDSTALELAVTTRKAHLPLARALAKRTRNSAVAERAAWAVTREAGRLNMSPSLLAAVLLIENRALDSSAVSIAGAVGLMQVMPLHAGSYGCASADLRMVDANICHGARILHTYMVRTKSVPRALKRYNGCVTGSVTPGCHRYPVRVLQTAARIRREILAETRIM